MYGIMMRQILVYGDSVSWGMVPGTRNRFPFLKRWPGRLEAQLSSDGLAVRVIENCLSGRRTVWEDPFRPGRNGAIGLHEAIEMNLPLALVIIAVGLNDFYNTDCVRAWASAQGIAKLVDIVSNVPVEAGQTRPEILVVAPPPISVRTGVYRERFDGAAERSHGLSDAYRSVAEAKGVHSVDLGRVTSASIVDGVHLDEDQHALVAAALAAEAARILRT
jgi:lysophospholipase L1-like esterase